MPDELVQTDLNDTAKPDGTAPADSQDPTVKKFGSVLKNLCTEHVYQDVDREKVYQYSKARKNELYWRGKQYVYPVIIGSDIADWSSTGTIAYNANPDERKNQYDYVLNVIRGDGRKFVAVLGQRGPNVKAEPDRVNDEQAIRRARKADESADYLRSQWDVEALQRHLAMSLWKNGTTFAYTHWVADASKYGEVQSQEIEMVPQKMGPDVYRCSVCGLETPASMLAPTGTLGRVMAGSCPRCQSALGPAQFQAAPTELAPQLKPISYPKGCVELQLATIFEVTCPFYGKTLKDLPWLWYEYEEHKGKLLAAWPELREKIASDIYAEGTGVSSQGRLARDVASSPTGSYISPRKNRWLYSRVWLKPVMYELIEDKDSRNELYAKFPKGCKVTMVQQEVVALDAEDLCDVWAMCKPETSEYIFADPICDDYMGIQDLINDMYNITVETLERSIPFMMADPTVLDLQQLRKHAGIPGEVVPVKAGVGGRLDQAIVKSPVADVDPAVMKWPDMIQEKGREMVGVLPAIFGGEGPSQTAREAELRRNQALQQLNTVWNEMRGFHKQINTNAVRILAQYALSDGSNLGNYTSDAADFQDLLEGGYHFEAEEAMPMTWGQRRDMVMFMMGLSPQVQQMFGLGDPLNLAAVQEVLGMTGWKVQNLDARDKVLDTIRQLLQQQPIPAPPPPMMPGGVAGPPSPDLPSIPIDSFEDDHMFSATLIKEWAQTEDGRKAKEQNPAGYQNVIAWGMAHLNALGNPPNPMPSGASPGNGQGPPGGPGGPPPGADTGGPAGGLPPGGPGVAGPPPSGGQIPPGPSPNPGQ